MADPDAPSPAGPDASPAGRVRRAARLRIRDLALLPAVVLLLVIGALTNDTFLERQNLINILG
ncbi:ABC transporter permease, partial [Streptomyces sp. MCAF7]